MSATSIQTLGLARPVVEFVGAVNAGDLGAAVAQLAPDAVHRTSSASYPPQAVRAMLGRLRAVFPDLSIEIRDQRVADNIVVSQLFATGTHRGSFLGRPASGERVSWESVDVAEVGLLDVGRLTAVGTSRYRVLARRWSLWNAPELFGRLGSVPG